MTEEKKNKILNDLKDRYNFDERGLFGVQALQNYVKKNNYVLARELESLRVGNFHYVRDYADTYLYYKTWKCNGGMLFANIRRSDFHTFLFRKIMEYVNTFNGIASWKGFIETSKILDKDYIERHPNAVFKWASTEEIDELVDRVWDVVYERLDKMAFYIREADDFIQSRREKEKELS